MPHGFLLVILSMSVLTPSPASAQVQFIRGDANADGRTDIADPIFILNYQFASGQEPSCLEAANVNGDEKLDLADPIGLLDFLFAEGAPPPHPYPGCGLPEVLHFPCEAFPRCAGRFVTVPVEGAQVDMMDGVEVVVLPGAFAIETDVEFFSGDLPLPVLEPDEAPLSPGVRIRFQGFAIAEGGVRRPYG